MTDFVLHEKLAADAAFIIDWPLSRLLLMKDARYPWIVLVPRRADIAELHQLGAEDRATLMEEIARAGKSFQDFTKAPKLNVGALGNIVPQLHIHIVGRAPGDPAWPGPVWGQGEALPYPDDALEGFVKALALVL